MSRAAILVALLGVSAALAAACSSTDLSTPHAGTDGGAPHSDGTGVTALAPDQTLGSVPEADLYVYCNDLNAYFSSRTAPDAVPATCRGVALRVGRSALTMPHADGGTASDDCTTYLAACLKQATPVPAKIACDAFVGKLRACQAGTVAEYDACAVEKVAQIHALAVADVCAHLLDFETVIPGTPTCDRLVAACPSLGTSP